MTPNFVRHWMDTKSRVKTKQAWITHSDFVLRLFKCTGSLGRFTTCCCWKEMNKLVTETLVSVFPNTWVFCYVMRLRQSTNFCFWGSNSVTKETWVTVIHYVALIKCVWINRDQSLPKHKGEQCTHSFSMGHQGTFEYLLCTHRIYRSEGTKPRQMLPGVKERKLKNCFWVGMIQKCPTLLF